MQSIVLNECGKRLAVFSRRSKDLGAALVAVLLAACSTTEVSIDFAEYDITTMQTMMEEGSTSSRQIVDYYLQRIDEIDRNGPALNAMIELNPDARAIATALDRERAATGARGPMHGIPVVLKANIDTADKMETTAGSLALKGHRPQQDAFVVEQLRKAGAVILGKANLSEWANYRSTRSSSGWSSIGGQTLNPYGKLRNPCGSSSGSAVAVTANLTSVAIGTETNGSIVCPASINGIVGIKPSLGLVSRSGIIPIAHSQDTAGPMARTVKDAAILLDAMVGPDPADRLFATFPKDRPRFSDNLSEDALNGARIGVLRNYRGAGNDPRVDRWLDKTAELMAKHGAVVVDKIEIEADGMGAASSTVASYEFKADLNDYLTRANAPLKSLKQIIDFNSANADRVLAHFGQERMLASQARGPLSDSEYLEALAKAKQLSQSAIDEALAAHDLDALIAPTRGTAWMIDLVNGDRSGGISSSSLAAISGYASVSVPVGSIQGLPIGVSFIGGQYSDARLIQLAYSLESAVGGRLVPSIE